MDNQPIYPKDNGSLERARERFRQKVANWNWNNVDENEYQGKPRGRKPKLTKRIESKPRTKLEKQAAETKQIYSNKFFNYK